MLDYLKPKKTGFEPNQYRNFGFEKSSGIPVLKALLSTEVYHIFKLNYKNTSKNLLHQKADCVDFFNHFSDLFFPKVTMVPCPTEIF
jgi:hypothetical protein